jgi:tetratricopeptide (TPR) repeat protein
MPLAALGLLAILFLISLNGCADQKKQAKGLVQSALKHRDAQRHAEAIQLLNRSIALDPALSEAWYLRGLSHAALKHQKDSIADLTAAVKLKPEWNEAWLALGVAQDSSGETALALKSYTEAIRQGIRTSAAWFDRANAYSKLGETQKSLDDLKAVLRMDPDHIRARMMHAQAIAETQPDEAITDLTHVIGIDRENSEAWLRRGLCWQKIADSDRALADLNVACRLTSADYRPWLERGRVLLKLGRVEDAISDLSRAVQYGTKDANCPYELGRAFAAAGNDTGAETNFAEALSLDPQHSDALLARAELRTRRGDHDQALADLHQISSSATQPEYSNAGISGDPDPKRMQRVAIEKAPKNREALQLRAEIYVAQDKPEEALADYDSLMSLGSWSEQNLLARAQLHIAAHRWEKAMQDVSEALNSHPNSLEALETRAKIYGQQAEYSLAITDLTAALQLNPDSADLLRQRADMFDQLGETDAASADLQHLVDLQPNDEALVKDLVTRLRKHQQISEAVSLLDRISQNSPTSMSAALVLLRSELQMDQGNFEGARSGMEMLAEADASSTAAAVLRARIAAAEKDDERVIKSLSQLTDEESTTEIRWLRASAMSRLGQLNEAETELSALLDAEPENVVAIHSRHVCGTGTGCNERRSTSTARNGPVSSRALSGCYR